MPTTGYVLTIDGKMKTRAHAASPNAFSGRAMTAKPTITPNDSRLLGPADGLRIDVDAPAEMRHWVRELGRPAAQVKAAVQAVGPLVSDVREYLRRRALDGLTR
jgi:hypothetical protein